MVNPKRLEALLSEYKGNLFEYLLAISLSRKYKIEERFLCSLAPDILTMLEQQEDFLRNYFPFLLKELPKLAEETSVHVVKAIKLRKADEIFLVGKVMGASNDKRFDEADILIKTKTKTIPLSIKISKNNSYVNTKSGGVRTFFSRYFGGFYPEELQSSFNKLCDFEYEALAIKMHEIAGIDYTEGFKNWEVNGLEVLPGQLNEELKEPLLSYYSFVNNELSKSLKKFYEEDEKIFVKCMAPLLGYSNEKIIQVTAFYTLKKDQFVKTSVMVHRLDEGLKLNGIEVRKNNFDILFDGLSLQIRVKPMNKFTSKAFKVNCAVKYL